MKICFIGFGNMAKAIARGLVSQKQYSISAAAPSLTSGINKDGINTFNDNKKAILDANILILAVKPMQMKEVILELRPCLKPNCLLISVAAGLSLSWFEKYCGENFPIIRTMPNILAQTGLSATPMVGNVNVSEANKKAAELIFSSVGITTWVEDENDIDTFTALSGSGPAYVFLFIESLIEAAVALGLEESIAKTFAFQTLKGALHLAENSHLNLNQLRTKVTSPKGTTAAALQILDPKLKELILQAMTAAKNRSIELGMSQK